MKFCNYGLIIIAGLMMVAVAACSDNNDNPGPRGKVIGTPKVIGSTWTAEQLDTGNDFEELTKEKGSDLLFFFSS